MRLLVSILGGVVANLLDPILAILSIGLFFTIRKKPWYMGFVAAAGVAVIVEIIVISMSSNGYYFGKALHLRFIASAFYIYAAYGLQKASSQSVDAGKDLGGKD